MRQANDANAVRPKCSSRNTHHPVAIEVGDRQVISAVAETRGTLFGGTFWGHLARPDEITGDIHVAGVRLFQWEHRPKLTQRRDDEKQFRGEKSSCVLSQRLVRGPDRQITVVRSALGTS